MNYLTRAFGDVLDDARDAMATLAGAHEPQELASIAYRLYEEFRAAIPSGIRGWAPRAASTSIPFERWREMSDEVKQGSPAIGDRCDP